MDNIADTMRRVPNDLLPIATSKYTTTWGQKTYKYAFLFDKDVTTTAYSNMEEVGKWVQLALRINEDLKQIGYSSCIDEIVKTSAIEYNMKMPTCITSPPTSLDDVVTIISDKVWYQVDTERKRRIIHMLCYGIFRQG